MNKDIMKAAGFGKEVELVDRGKCPFCRQRVNPSSFKDEISRKEFHISGLCQKCQNKVFQKPDE